MTQATIYEVANEFAKDKFDPESAATYFMLGAYWYQRELLRRLQKLVDINREDALNAEGADKRYFDGILTGYKDIISFTDEISKE